MGSVDDRNNCSSGCMTALSAFSFPARIRRRRSRPQKDLAPKPQTLLGMLRRTLLLLLMMMMMTMMIKSSQNSWAALLKSSLWVDGVAHKAASYTCHRLKNGLWANKDAAAAAACELGQ